MGFSVSGAAAVIFLSTFLAFGMLYTAADNSAQEVVDAQDDRSDRALETKNTAITVVSVDVEEDEGGEEAVVTVTANNTGATGLSLSGTSLVFDNELQQGWEEGATVDGTVESDLWLPGETLVASVTVDLADVPERISLATESGLTATAEVETGGDGDGN